MSLYAQPVTSDTIHVPYEDEVIVEHTDTDLFCDDGTCPCHEDNENIAIVGEFVDDGLMTPNEADRYYRGGTI